MAKKSLQKNIRLRKRSEKIGLPPGTLLYLGNKEKKPEKISIIKYNEKDVFESQPPKLQINDVKSKEEIITWINIENYSVDSVNIIGENLKIHPLIMEDILNTDQRPKIEESKSKLIIFLKLLFWDSENNKIVQDQATIIVWNNMLVSFIETENTLFFPIIERIKKSKGRIRSSGIDYLLYSLVDIIIDNYFIVLESIQDNIERLEDELELNPTQSISEEIRDIKWQTVLSRKSIWPIRDIINKLLRQDIGFITEPIQIYFRDILDHIIYILDSIESDREMISGLRESHMAAMSNRMNQIINMLTIISSIFIPISFLTGLYGMNFVNIPELKTQNGYFVLIGAMISIIVFMLYIFKKKRWL